MKSTNRPFRLALFTCMWGRSRLTKMVLAHNARIQIENVEILRIAVYSREDPDPTLGVPGWTYVKHPNRPISDKWQAGAKHVRKLDVDAMMIFGSDDFLNAAFIEEAVSAIQRGHDYVMPKSLYFYDTACREAIYCQLIGRVGGGRTLSRRLLEKLRWDVWELGYQKNIDGCMDRRLIEIGHKHPDYTIDDIRSTGALLLGIKLGEGGNMHAFDKMRRGLQGEPVDAELLLAEYVPEYTPELLAW